MGRDSTNGEPRIFQWAVCHSFQRDRSIVIVEEEEVQRSWREHRDRSVVLGRNYVGNGKFLV